MPAIGASGRLKSSRKTSGPAVGEVVGVGEKVGIGVDVNGNAVVATLVGVIIGTDGITVGAIVGRSGVCVGMKTGVIVGELPPPHWA
ncbi:MAG: hypothetical protein AAB691_01745, partial [Patescibacteria group bacterium]